MPSSSVPALIVVVPVYVSAPVNVNVPPPALVSAVELAPLLITPANVVDVPSPPAVSVAAAPVLVTTAPAAPASDPIALLNPFKSSDDTPFNVTALFADSLFAPPA